MTDELSIIEEVEIEDDLSSPTASSIMPLPSPWPVLVDNFAAQNQPKLPLKTLSERKK